jgi:hypothetical protein
LSQRRQCNEGFRIIHNFNNIKLIAVLSRCRYPLIGRRSRIDEIGEARPVCGGGG